ncbi:CIR protein [Plasmodium chabaudi chabaudi]|uniref:CIR protein n=1 Tax=Plasmodium chabaudi chabaudi TaxID=31271 RepID=A0A4V0K386_PLACU|nr:CIR protein [Plasmodium chabaudi chabaudi]VTZ66766.1 CIR protein [Plasmodium chabaudi chabaudi]|eukprot:XP_016652930.1 CIR protein [Plasmodium chabaudi chabaudi]
MSEEVCEAFKKVDDCLQIGMVSTGDICYIDEVLNEYCPTNIEGQNGKCDTNNEKISAGFIWLLITFEDLCEGQCSDNENEKYAEYAILWLNYKLNQNSEDGINTLNDFYTKYIEKNTHYNQKISKANDNKTYKNIIDKKKNLMNMDINDIFRFYDAFESLCSMYNELGDENPNCGKCSQKADEFVNKYDKLNEDPNITGNNSYKKILTTLFDDYGNLKKKCDDDPSSDFPTLSPIKTTQSFEDASSGSSVASKLIPVLSIFAISLFLGIAYKYSLFGFDKLFQRQYIRKKLKKIKKKMELNI